jgi:hypothetical protein
MEDEVLAKSMKIDDSTRDEAAPVVEELRLHVPEGALIPAGATFYEGDDDGRCRVIKLDGERCRGSRSRDTGLCPGHAGRGGITTDPRAASLKAAAVRSQRRQARMLLGVSARRAAEPVQASRIRALSRANDFAKAIVDAPLDDETLSTLQRQQAAVKAVELLFPQVTAQLDVDVPVDQEGVAGLDWEQLQALAQAHLGGDQEVTSS